MNAHGRPFAENGRQFLCAIGIAFFAKAIVVGFLQIAKPREVMNHDEQRLRGLIASREPTTDFLGQLADGRRGFTWLNQSGIELRLSNQAAPIAGFGRIGTGAVEDVEAGKGRMRGGVRRPAPNLRRESGIGSRR